MYRSKNTDEGNFILICSLTLVAVCDDRKTLEKTARKTCFIRFFECDKYKGHNVKGRNSY